MENTVDLQMSTEIEELLEEIKDLNEKGYEEIKEIVPKGLKIVNNYIIKIRTVVKRILLASNGKQLSDLFFKLYGVQLERLQMILSVRHYDTIEYIEISKLLSKVMSENSSSDS